MGNRDWWEEKGPPAWHLAPPPPTAPPPTTATTMPDRTPARPRRRTWPLVAVIAALALTSAGIWQHAQDQRRAEEREQKAAAYKGKAGTEFHLDGIKTEVIAQWNRRGTQVQVTLRAWSKKDPKYLHIAASGRAASAYRKYGWYTGSPKITLPVKDHLADVTVRVQVGGETWTKGTTAPSRTVRLSPTDNAYDGETGQELPPN